jgi:DNA polymerase (family 10)
MRDAKRVEAGLENIAILLGLSGKEGWKAAAYQRGAEIVHALGADKLEVAIEAGRMRDIDGIGASLAKQIDELWNLGRSELLERLEAEHPPGAAELARLPGMTARRIRTLSAALGIRSIDELRAACDAQRVRAVTGFGEKLELKLRAACDRVHELTPPRRMLLVEVNAMAAQLRTELLAAGVVDDVQLAGAARRGEESVGELELLVVTRDPDAFWPALDRAKGVFAVDREQLAAQLNAGIELRLYVVPPERAGTGFVYATGTAEHVAALEACGLSRVQPPAAADGCALLAERAVYHALRLEHTPPELRASEGALAELGSGRFAALLEATHVCGMVHCHTTYSDGRDSIEGMARAAEALGMQYITITDHSPAAHYARGVELDRLREQWDEIARVQELVHIKILRGTESDILIDGDLDYPEAILEQLDVVIASVHSRFKLEPEAMTQRLVRAMKNPIFKIWGHALGRMILSRAPIQCDVRRVLDALADSRGAVEINADPHRLDLAPEWIPHARERGIPFVISVDAHSTRGFEYLPLGITMARRGGVQRDEVLNTMPTAEFIRRVRPAQ